MEERKPAEPLQNKDGASGPRLASRRTTHAAGRQDNQKFCRCEDVRSLLKTVFVLPSCSLVEIYSAAIGDTAVGSVTSADEGRVW